MSVPIEERNRSSTSSFCQGEGVDDNVGGENTPNCIHFFGFYQKRGMRKEKVKQNNIEENSLLIKITVTMTDTSPEAWWFLERSVATGYVSIVMSASFVGRETTQSHSLTFTP